MSLTYDNKTPTIQMTTIINIYMMELDHPQLLIIPDII